MYPGAKDEWLEVESRLPVGVSCLLRCGLHGRALGDHGLRRKGCRFYECLVRVPLIFSWPSRFKKGLESDALVELTDIVPTLLEAAGMPVPNTMHGKSLLPICQGKAHPHTHREFVRSIYYRVLAGAPSYASMIRTRRRPLLQTCGTILTGTSRAVVRVCGRLFRLAASASSTDTGHRYVAVTAPCRSVAARDWPGDGCANPGVSAGLRRTSFPTGQG